jgi:DNA-binding NtrC family response regulator
VSLSVDERQRGCWPAALILTSGRSLTPFHALMDLVELALRLHRWRASEPISPERLRSPAKADDVLDWLNEVWQRLERVDLPDILAERRSLVREIVQADLTLEEQTKLVNAVDYLARLSAARKRSRTSLAPDAVQIPVTRSPLMQAAYLKIVSLAATDLPVWLAGEKGSELDSTARLIHQLRGLPDRSFVTVDQRHSHRIVLEELSEAFGTDHTLFLAEMDRASEAVQKTLYRHMMSELGKSPSFRIIVSTGAVEQASLTAAGVIPELMAFLGATRVDLPPLRRRLEDLPALVSFIASQRNLEDPVKRFTPEALEKLRDYHWPGNAHELDLTLAFILQKRPAGPIRCEDLPDSVKRGGAVPDRLAEVLEELLQGETFRILKSQDGWKRLAGFLRACGSEQFGANDVQRSFQMGRETVRRLLQVLQERGVVLGIKGVQGKRTTRYRWINGKDSGQYP